MSIAGSRILVVNLNGPELNALALHLARQGRLAAYVRPYVNKGRNWEKALARVPLMGAAYARSFGRRGLGDSRLLALIREAGVFADLGAAVVERVPALPARWRRGLTQRCQEAIRDAVGREGGRGARVATSVVAMAGFAGPAFEAIAARGKGLAILSYPIAHHRYHRERRREESELDPEFASMWPEVDDWAVNYEAVLDAEIEAADLILVGSRYVRETFVRQHVDAARIAVVPYGVDVGLFAPSAGAATPEADRFRVLFSGQIGQRKGISYLLKAYRQFARPGTELTLVGRIVGSSKPLAAYATLFRHVPHLTRPALAAAYRDADVFVMPSLVEGMPLVVLEAMASGLPVIVTANGPVDVVRDGIDGYVIPERNSDAIRDCLARLHQDVQLRKDMGRNARARALEFGWDVYGARVEQALDGVAVAHGAPGSSGDALGRDAA